MRLRNTWSSLTQLDCWLLSQQNETAKRDQEVILFLPSYRLPLSAHELIHAFLVLLDDKTFA